MNSKRPNGVIMAVLGISSGSIGICLYACTRSILLKIVVPWRDAVKS